MRDTLLNIALAAILALIVCLIWDCSDKTVPEVRTVHSEKLVTRVVHDTVNIPTISFKYIKGDVIPGDTTPCSNFSFTATQGEDTVSGYVDCRDKWIRDFEVRLHPRIVYHIDTLREIRDSILTTIAAPPQPLFGLKGSVSINPLSVVPVASLEGQIKGSLNLGDLSVFAAPSYGLQTGVQLRAGVEINIRL